MNNLKWAKLKGDTWLQPRVSLLQRLYCFHYTSVQYKHFDNLSAAVGEVKAADDGVGHHERDDVWAGGTGALHSNGDVSQWQIVVAHTDLGGIDFRLEVLQQPL